MNNDEEDINFEKNCSNITISDSMSALTENASTYMGVKTIPEGTIPDNNEINNADQVNNKNKKRAKQKKRKKDSLSSSISSSSESYSSSSSSYISSFSSSECEYNDELSKKKKKKIINKKTEKEKNKKIKNVKKPKKIEKNEGNEKKEEKIVKKDEIETKFEWDEGGNMVYVTGSFCEWNKFFLMTKNKEGKYTISIPLPKGFHQYKFKVDGIWTYSQTQPKFEDNGNVNNYIDTTDFDNLNEEKEKEINDKEITKKEKSQKKENAKRKCKTKEKVKEKEENKGKKGKKKSGIKFKIENNNDIVNHRKNSSSHNIHFINNHNKYSVYYPLRTEFSKKPSALPGLYKTYYILNEKKNNNLKIRKFSQIEYVDNTNNSIHNISENQSNNQSLNNSLYFVKDINPYDPYVKFQNLYHIHSNHLHSKEVNHVQNTVTSIISRYRFKFSTFIYYKENNPNFTFDKKNHSKTVKIKRDKVNK